MSGFDDIVVNAPPVTIPATPVPVPAQTPRGAMVDALMRYFGLLEFRRPETIDDVSQSGRGQFFKFNERDLLAEWPDPEVKLNYPSVVILPGSAHHEPLAFTPQVDESTFDVYAPGTALVQLAEYAETLQVAVWAADRYERRSLEAVMVPSFTPSDRSYGLQLRTQGYFDRIASYQLVRQEEIDGEETVRNVRRFDLYVEGRIPVVKLMPFRRIKLGVEVDVTEAVLASVLREVGAHIVVPPQRRQDPGAYIAVSVPQRSDC